MTTNNKGLGRLGVLLAVIAYGVAFINAGLGIMFALSGAILYIMTMKRGN